MRRTRRHKFLQFSVFFLVYSIIHVYSEKLNSTIISESSSPTNPTPQHVSTTATPPTTSETKSTESVPITTTSGSSKDLETTPGTTSHPTWRPRRTNCTPPAIEQFPKPLMGPWGRKHGGLLLHVIVAIYTFFGLAIVCDEYFVASLDRICEELKMSPDVAGATFMAAGSSAPELATVVIGVFFAKDDIGVSGVIGSAVFNIMFVISVCALCSGTVSYLNWWPLVRDCIFYAFSILIMLFTIYNEIISWPESLFMLCMYVVYCIVLHFNPQLERWAQTLPWAPIKKVIPNEESALVNYKTLNEEKRCPSYGGGSSAEMTMNNTGGELEYATLNAWDMEQSGPELNQVVSNPPPPQEMPMVPPQQQQQQVALPAGAVPANQDYYKPKEIVPGEIKRDPLVRPEATGLYVQASWAIVYPIHYMCRKTIPNCKTEQYKNWYPFTFFISMVWISFYSYFMVWMITIIGSTLGIPDTVMGLTFVAAGVSVPDALSSIAVIKEGYGDMAVSNAIGSNVFDILICLGLPWFIQTAIIKPGSHVNVISKGLTYSTLSLLSTVIFLVVATHLNGWKLDKKLGIVLMIWYIIFITFASLYELNVFGELNPAECLSLY